MLTTSIKHSKSIIYKSELLLTVHNKSGDLLRAPDNSFGGQNDAKITWKTYDFDELERCFSYVEDIARAGTTS
jgi:hypothetical protein